MNWRRGGLLSAWRHSWQTICRRRWLHRRRRRRSPWRRLGQRIGWSGRWILGPGGHNAALRLARLQSLKVRWEILCGRQGHLEGERRASGIARVGSSASFPHPPPRRAVPGAAAENDRVTKVYRRTTVAFASPSWPSRSTASTASTASLRTSNAASHRCPPSPTSNSTTRLCRGSRQLIPFSALSLSRGIRRSTQEVLLSRFIFLT